MAKKWSILVIVVVALALVVIPLAEAKPKPKCGGQAGKSNVAHLYLYQSIGVMNKVKGEAWGKMKSLVSGPAFDFVFNGKRLEKEVDYTLIALETDELGAIVGTFTCLGSDVSNRGGNVHIVGELPDLGDFGPVEIRLVGTEDLVSLVGEDPCAVGELPPAPPPEEPPVPLPIDEATALFGCTTISFDDTDEAPAP